MPNFKMRYANISKVNSGELPYIDGCITFIKDCQQILIDIQGYRRKYSGIVEIQYQNDRLNLTNPCKNIYFVFQTAKLYYYNNGWISLQKQSVQYIDSLSSLTTCDQTILYYIKSTNQLYSGVNSTDGIQWTKINSEEIDLSNYNGNLNLSNSNGDNILSCNEDENIVVGNSNSTINIIGNILYNGNSINSSLGLVCLDQNGKIPSTLFNFDSSDFADSTTSILFLSSLTSKNTDSISQLSSTVASNVSSIEDNASAIADNKSSIEILNSDDSINGSVDYKIKKALQNINLNSSCFSNAVFNTISFSPYNDRIISDTQYNNHVCLKYGEDLIDIDTPTIVQLIDDTGLIRDDVIPVYWQNDGLYINFNDLIQQGYITSQTSNYKIQYLVAEQYNASNNSNTLNKITFSVYGLTDNIKHFTFEQLGLENGQTTMIQLIDDTGLIRDDIIPVYWEVDGLYINVDSVSSLITSDTEYSIMYLVKSSNAYDIKIEQLTNRVNVLTEALNILLASN